MTEYMQTDQRGLELRYMFIELAKLLFSDMKSGKSLSELEETIVLMQKILAELSKLEGRDLDMIG